MVNTNGNEVPSRFETVSLPNKFLVLQKKQTREKTEQMGEFAYAKVTSSKVVKCEKEDV